MRKLKPTPTPLVSVIIPVYNSGKTAAAAIRSVVNNTYPNYEIIVVDDGSTDTSLDLLRSTAFPHTKIYSRPNGGVSSARNFGISKSKGKYLAFIDSDDSVAPTYLSSLVSALESTDSPLTSSALIYHRLTSGTKETLYSTPFPRRKHESRAAYVLRSLLTDGRLYVVYNKLFRADIIKNQNIRFDETMDYAEDTKFVLDYLAATKGDISFVLEPLYIYNYGSTDSLAKRSEANWAKWRKSLDNLRLWLGSHPSIQERFLYYLVSIRWRLACFRAKFRKS